MFKEIRFEVAGIRFNLNNSEHKKQEIEKNNDNLETNNIKKIYTDLNKSNDIKIDIQLDENKIYYNEIINFFCIGDSIIPDIIYSARMSPNVCSSWSFSAVDYFKWSIVFSPKIFAPSANYCFCHID